MEKKTQYNPLTTLWQIFSTICGITSLSSMVETWMEDLLKWKGFIATIIESYRSLTEPIFAWIFGWLPFSVPTWVGDYLIFGFIFMASVIKGGFFLYHFSAFDLQSLSKYFELYFWKTIFLYLVGIIIWPIALIFVILYFILALRARHILSKGPFVHTDSKGIKHIVGVDEIGEPDLRYTRNSPGGVMIGTFQWLGAIILGFVLLLAINAQL